MKNLLAAVLLLEFSSLCLGQSQPVSVLNVNNGLSSGTIECGLYDSRGFIWLGTRDGLHRYDGKNIIRYLPDESDSNAIHSKIISYIAEDPKGQLWIIGDNGLEVFILENNKFIFLSKAHFGDIGNFANISFYKDLDIGIYSIAFPPGYGLFSLKNHRLIQSQNELTKGNYTKLGTQWFFKTETNTICSPFIKNQSYNLFHYHSPDFLFRRIGKDKSSLWVSTKEAGYFLNFVNGIDTPKVIWLKGLPDSIFENTNIRMKDYNDSIGLCSVNSFGILMFNKSTGGIIKYWDFRRDPILSRIAEINLLFNDPSGRIWFSIMPYGLFVLNPNSPRFQLLKNGMPGSLIHNGLMRSMFCDTSGRLWIGFHDGKLQILNSSCTAVPFEFELKSVNSSPPAITSIAMLPNGNSLVNLGLEIKIDQGEVKTSWIEDKPCYSAGAVLLNKEFPVKQLVFLSSVNKRNVLVVKENYKYYIADGPKINEIANIFISKENYLFDFNIQSYFRVFRFFDRDGLIPFDNKRLKQNVHSVYQSPGSDSLWFACSKGMFIYNVCDKSISEVDISEWPSQYLYGILDDDQGNLWVSTNGGIVRYNPKTKVWKCFTIKDGLQSNEFNMNCFAKLKNGSLAFGGPEGLNVFDPRYFDNTPQAFNTYLTAIKINEKQLDWFNSFSNDQKYYLQPGEKSLEIEFTSTVYSQREGINYFVQLENADPEWIDIGSKESVRYINLKPGIYKFKVKAKNADGDWSQNVNEANFIVIPYFYQTTWFLVLCAFVFCGLVYALYMYRIKQLRNLQIMRNRISHDLHDDIGSTLGSISIYSEVAKFGSEENRNEVLQKIGDGSREMLDKLNDIVWSINPENDHLDRMESRMRNFAAMTLNPSGISFNISFNIDNPKQVISMEQRRNLFLIFKEALHNAVKYAQCKHINIYLNQKQGKLTLEIRDNGKGFEINNIEVYNGTGMKSMMERAKSIGADFKIESHLGKGTALIVNVK
ncbi:MAG: two-component regulator propeller domain-containing protein [Saprospiraceae bacterium]